MRLSKLPLILVITVIAVFVLPRAVFACGCGFALSDAKTYNALKETQAYLLIDVLDENSYVERPFFRMVSMDMPYDVKLVFPLKDVPANVTGKKITAAKLLSEYNINEAEANYKTQQLRTLVDNMKEPLFVGVNGFIGRFYYILTHNLVGLSDKGIGNSTLDAFRSNLDPVAHFEFEGGKMDMYDVQGGQKLGELVKTINTPLSDEVLKTINKYKDYYVAVLTLTVPSVINTADIDILKQCLPAELEEVQNKLTAITEFTDDDIQTIVNDAMASNNCPMRTDVSEKLTNYISNALNSDSSVEGILVNMEYKGNSHFFYPTSLVNTYKYPIMDQRYFVKVPNNLAIKFSDSLPHSTINLNSDRWYKTTSTVNDLNGVIVKAGLVDKGGDFYRIVISELNNYLVIVVTVLWVLIFTLPLLLWKKTNKLTKLDYVVYFGGYIGAGLLFVALVAFTQKKKKLGAFYLIAWFLLLAGFVLKSS